MLAPSTCIVWMETLQAEKANAVDFVTYYLHRDVCLGPRVAHANSFRPAIQLSNDQAETQRKAGSARTCQSRLMGSSAHKLHRNLNFQAHVSDNYRCIRLGIWFCRQHCCNPQPVGQTTTNCYHIQHGAGVGTGSQNHTSEGDCSRGSTTECYLPQGRGYRPAVEIRYCMLGRLSQN